MHTLILSDFHANLDAFESVVATALRRRIDRWICLDDVVGYGADPGACIEVTSSLAETTLLGNRDAAVAGLQDVAYFSSHARQAIAWTKHHVSAWKLECLTRIPLMFESEEAHFVHAEPADPLHRDCIHSAENAAAAMGAITNRLYFVGHTHEAFLCITRNSMQRSSMPVTAPSAWNPMHAISSTLGVSAAT